MRGHNICLYAELTKIIPNYHQILSLSLCEIYDSLKGSLRQIPTKKTHISLPTLTSLGFSRSRFPTIHNLYIGMKKGNLKLIRVHGCMV